jgi:hypothetical protein
MAGIFDRILAVFRLSRAVIILEAARMFESFTAKIRSTLLRISALRFYQETNVIKLLCEFGLRSRGATRARIARQYHQSQNPQRL